MSHHFIKNSLKTLSAKIGYSINSKEKVAYYSLFESISVISITRAFFVNIYI